MKQSIDVHGLRNGTLARDRAICDLLELRQLEHIPGSVSVQSLKALWDASQPQVSRRMAAIHQLGIYSVKSAWGCYRLFTPDEIRAKRWETMRRRMKQAVS
jgi:hypothetical protein